MSMRGTAAIVGAGRIGAGWAARFLLNGWDVAVADPAPEVQEQVAAVLDRARRTLPALYDRALPPEGALSFAPLAAAVSSADWIQESGPDRLDRKHAILSEIAALAPVDAVIASSSARFPPSDLNANGGRALVARACDPVYLLPLVELAGEGAEAAADTLRSLGLHPLILQKGGDVSIAGRLRAALWREALELAGQGLCDQAQIDEAIRLGPALLWALTGPFGAHRSAASAAETATYADPLGPASTVSPVDLAARDAAERTGMAQQADAWPGAEEADDLARLRDDTLVAMIRALRRTEVGAGGIVVAHESTLPGPASAELPVTIDRAVPLTWTDYNGHMNEAHYLEAAGRANDRFMELIGADVAYVASGKSYFTVENHVCYLAEMQAGERLRVTTQVLDGAGKKMLLFHRILNGAGELCATVESMQLHVDLGTRKTCQPAPPVAARLTAYADAHARLPRPEQAGRGIGAPR